MRMGGVKEMRDNRITGIAIQAPLLSSQQFFNLFTNAKAHQNPSVCAR